MLGLRTEHCVLQCFQLSLSADLPLHLLPQQEGLEAGGEAGGPRHLLHLSLSQGQAAVDSDVGNLAQELMECRVIAMLDHSQGEKQSGRRDIQALGHDNRSFPYMETTYHAITMTANCP